MKASKSLKVVMVPWLAMGHLTPFLELSKSLAKNGLQVYFVTTPNNIARLPKLPPNLTSSITLVSIPLPHLDGVPDQAESSMDVPSILQPLLKMRFDLLESPISAFLEEVQPDWILYDFTSYWIPTMAAKMGVSCAYIALFNAASLSFIGPPSALLGNVRSSLDDYTVVPCWIPFESDIAYRPYEVVKFEHSVDARIATSDTVRFGNSIAGCDFVGIRTSPEFEPIWINLLEKLYGKIVLPIGFLFPDCNNDDNEDLNCDNWAFFKEWLDRHEPGSVLYVAFGSESSLTQEEVYELGFGLEHSGVPFVLILQDPPGSDKNVIDMLPEGFVGRVAGRGLVHRGWAPQVKILRHQAIRGFLSHCGWNSVIEGLGLGRVLVLLPVMNDQGLVARLLVGQGLGVEIERGEKDGALRSESVIKAVRLAMVEKEGEEVRIKCRNMTSVFGDNKLNDGYIEAFVSYLEENKKSK
ncbi:UDP-glycosyltransferase 91C1-like [Silene latifolia]|uniref:UDP-glycosyltransferase 91C1-like n=1 Tax=Silene latifolia TaxID=37657 RepID=UPI003D76AC9C